MIAISEVISAPWAKRAGQNTANARASQPARAPNSPRAQRQINQSVSTPNKAMVARPSSSMRGRGLPSL